MGQYQLLLSSVSYGWILIDKSWFDYLKGTVMVLFPMHRTVIHLPEYLLNKTTISGNVVCRIGIPEKQIEVDIHITEYKNWYKLIPVCQQEFDVLYLRVGGGKKQLIDNNKFTLEHTKKISYLDITLDTKLRWVSCPVSNKSLSANEVTQYWENQFVFREEVREHSLPGLRTPQLGALHALSAYFTSSRNIEPATVVLPTGTGKTDTMIAITFYKCIAHTLVLVPSAALREQIFHKFLTLGCLKDLQTIPFNAPNPYVCMLKKGLRSMETANSILEKSNVIIATPDILNSSNKDVVKYLCDNLSTLIIDEAHHVSAKTWTIIRDLFKGKKIIQFTATPFRNDRDSLGGKIIFNYTMGEAQNAGYFRQINFMPVEEYSAYNADMAIAQKATLQLQQDLSQGKDHIIMARVNTKSRANELVPIYQRLAPGLNPLVIHSGLSQNEQNKCLSALFTRSSRLIICVNMLGEGFDFPNLKIAAIHDIHKSLAITLQFVGRFTRDSNNIGDATMIVNTADPEVESNLQKLYASDANWNDLLKRLSEHQIEREMRLQEIVENLSNEGDLGHQISLWNLRPGFSTVLFKTSCDGWSPLNFSKVLPSNTKYWHSLDSTQNILIVLAIYQSPVKWGNYKDLNDILYKLLIAQWDNTRNALFFYSNDYKWFHIDELAKTLCNQQCEPYSGEEVFNIFNNMKMPLVKNLGTSQVGAVSFTQYFGPNVTEGLSRIAQANSSLSNMLALGYEDGDKVIWGCSQRRGKVWSLNSGTIADWSLWTQKVWDKASSGTIDINNITSNFLRPEKISSNYHEPAIAIQWGEHIQAKLEEQVFIVFGNNEIALYLVDINIENTDNFYNIIISSETELSCYSFLIDEQLPFGFQYKHLSGPLISIKRSARRIELLEEYLQIDPVIIQYVDNAFSYNCYLIKPAQFVGEYNKDLIEAWNWNGIDIHKESMGKQCEIDSIQWKAFKEIEQHYDIVINDDGAGEAADLIAIKVLDNKIYLNLIHCKYSKKDIAGARVADLYELCGQAQKSVHRKHSGFFALYRHIKSRNAKWHPKSRFLKGNLSDLSVIKNQSRAMPLFLHITLIQPGVSKIGISHDMLKLLGSTESYIKDTANAFFTFIGSS